MWTALCEYPKKKVPNPTRHASDNGTLTVCGKVVVHNMRDVPWVGGDGTTTCRVCAGNGRSSPLGSSDVAVALNPNESGRVGELVVAADLISRGFTVYAPLLSRLGAADIIAVHRTDPDYRPVRFEVRVGSRNMNGVLRFNRRDALRADYYAIVVHGEPVMYEPELPLYGTREAATMIHRLHDAAEEGREPHDD